MTISIALCTYNGERYLQAQLDSYAAQTRLPDELVVCDDGSTDATWALLEAFAARAPFRVRLYRNSETLRVTKNFERAISLCEGELIATSDQDDVWLPDKLARCEAALARGAALVFTDSVRADASLKPLDKTFFQHYGMTAQRLRLVCETPLPALLRFSPISGAQMMFRASLRALCLPICAGWYHDGWIGVCAAAQGGVIALDERLILYRQHAANVVGAHTRTWRERAAWALTDRRNDYARRGEQMTAGADRLRLVAPAAAAWLDDAASHLAVRGSLPDARLRRFAPVVRELATGRYTRYSEGAVSAAKDVLAS